MPKQSWQTWSVASLLLVCASSSQAASVLFNETFSGVDSGYVNAPTGQGGTHSITVGVPTNGGGSTINGGADENWYGARFEYSSDGGLITSHTTYWGKTVPGDIGVQQYSGLGRDAGTANGNHVGLVSDDGGLLFNVSTAGFNNIQLSFDWRTFLSESGDQLVAGYYIGDLTAGHPTGFAADRTIDLRNVNQGGGVEGPGADGPWNWNPATPNVGTPGNAGNWVEILRSTNNGTWTSENFVLPALDNQQEVWVAFWLDNGNADFGKIDDIKINGTAVVPVPPAVWLFGSGLLGLVGISRRKTS